MIPRWRRWTLLALLSWGVWTIMTRLMGVALSGADSQALSTLGILLILVVLALGKKSPAPGEPRRGVFQVFAAGAWKKFA